MNKYKKLIANILALIMVAITCFGLNTPVAYAATAVNTWTSPEGVKYTIGGSGNKILTITGSGVITNEWQDKLYAANYYYFGEIEQLVINSDNITGCDTNAFILRNDLYGKLTRIGGSVAATGMTDLWKVTITKYNKAGGYAWDSDAFKGNATISNLTLGTSMKSIKEGCFSNMASLTTVSFSALTEIPKDAFKNDYVLNVVSGINSATITTIGESAFEHTAIRNITLGGNITSIGKNAFKQCGSLQRVIIPSTTKLNSIEEGAFSYCGNLSTITTNTSIISYLPTTLSSIGKDAFYMCSSLTRLRITNTDCFIYDNRTTIPSSTTIVGYGKERDDISTAKLWAEKYNRFYFWHGDEITFAYKGRAQTFTSNVDGIYKIECYGAGGGNSSIGIGSVLDNKLDEKGLGSNGSYASIKISLEENDTLYVYVGGKGGDAASRTYPGAGGWNGGGSGITKVMDKLSGATSYSMASGGGGGATDVRTSTNDAAITAYTDTRIVVAGGGAGGGKSGYQLKHSENNFGDGGNNWGGGIGYFSNGVKKTGSNGTSGFSNDSNNPNQPRLDITGGGGGGYYGGKTIYNGNMNCGAYKGTSYAASGNISVKNGAGTRTATIVAGSGITNATGGSSGNGSCIFTVDELSHYEINYHSNHEGEKDFVHSEWFKEGESLFILDCPIQLEAFAYPKNCDRGCVFAGWNTEPDGSGIEYAIGEEYSELKDLNLYAQWEAATYTVMYDANGGVGAPESQTKTHGIDLVLSDIIPTRAGYSFIEWNTFANGLGTGYQPEGIYSANENVTLYAQWKKSITYTFNYYNNKSASVTVNFHNDATNAILTSFENDKSYDIYFDNTNINEADGITISSLTDDITHDGCDWTSRGITYNDSSSNTKVTYNKGTTSIDITTDDGEEASNTRIYYVSYERTPQLTLISYGDNEQETQVIKGTVTIDEETYESAGLTYAGDVDREPVFTFPDLSNMKLKEVNAAGNEVNEGWFDEAYNQSIGSNSIGTKLGWTTSTETEADVEQEIGSEMATYKDATYYGLYSKNVMITYDANGGTIDPESHSYIRYANAADVTNATKSEITFAVPTWLENGAPKYTWCGWLYKKLAVNEEINMFDCYLVGTTNDAGSFTYTPLVSDTVYAYWVTEPINHMPTAIITKSAEWATPTSDNSVVDYDNLQNIDIDGIAKVTVKLTITNKENIGARSIKVTDYFDTDKWVYYQDDTHKISASTGSVTRSNDTFTWRIPDDYTSEQEMTLIYYVQLKESYWDVDSDTEEYINAVKDLASYKNELDEYGNLKSTSTYQTKDEKALINLKYVINGGLLSGIPVSKYNATPYVIMRPVNWIPTTYGLEIETGRNVYQDITEGIYNKTYFVQYDTKSVDSSNSTFKITSNASIRRSYPFYQITDNFLDMYKDSTNQVIDNNIGLNVERSNTVLDVTESKKIDGYSAAEYLKAKTADNVHTPKKTGTEETGFVQYRFGALTSVDSMYATNQDNVKFSIYPFVKVTNSKLNTAYETTRDRDVLENQRLDITIDATDPIIIPDERIETESEEYGVWTASDGYADINLVDNYKNPTAQSKVLTFKFEDAVSGISAPSASESDWIKYSNDNVQVKLERVDNEPMVIFDSATNESNNSDVVKVNYTSTSGLNKTGDIQVILNHTNNDILGHLKLTIRVYDNVSNWTEKTYDLYVFCLTGEISIADTLPSYSERLDKLTDFRNGEMGTVKVSANGYADRVTVNFGTYLNSKYSQEAAQRVAFVGDRVRTLDGDYPKTDLESVGSSSLITATSTEGIPILPYEWQVCRWGYADDELGGIRLAEVTEDTYEYDNTILQEHLSDLIERYQGMEQGESYEVESGSDYVIVGSTLYTYPEMDGDSVINYENKYELGGYTFFDNTLYPVYVVLNDTNGITIKYTEETVESDESRNIIASVEDTTIVGLSNWVQVGSESLRPFVHYFFMPLGAEQKTDSDPYYVTITSFKDSEKDFKHSVSIKLSFTNSGSILDDIIVILKDN